MQGKFCEVCIIIDSKVMGHLSLAHDEINKLRAAISIAHYPNVDAVAKQLAGGKPSSAAATHKVVYSLHMIILNKNLEEI